MASVTVRGEAFVPGKPDEVRVELALSTVRPAADDAYNEVAQRSEQLDSVLDAAGVERGARSTAGVTVQEHVEYDEHGRPQHRGYMATNRLLLRLGDPAVVARVLRESVTSTGARVSGPWWRIAPANPAREAACRDAAADARRRASAYADGLGLRVGAVLDAFEPGIAPIGPRRSAKAFEHVVAYQPDAEIRVDPGELDVRAAIDVTFALEPA